MNPWSSPIYPNGGIETIDAWCYSINNKKYLDGPTEKQTPKPYFTKDHVAFEKINEIFKQIPEPYDPSASLGFDPLKHKPLSLEILEQKNKKFTGFVQHIPPTA